MLRCSFDCNERNITLSVNGAIIDFIVLSTDHIIGVNLTKREM